MTYVVTENCILCKHTSCVEVCPVDCFYEGEKMLVINPDECIDCGLCQPQCPSEAIKADTELASDEWLKVNASFSKAWPNITVSNGPLPGAKFWDGFKGKSVFVDSRSIDFGLVPDIEMLSNYQKLAEGSSISRSEWEAGLNGRDRGAKILLLSRKDFLLSPDRVNWVLNEMHSDFLKLFIELQSKNFEDDFIDILLKNSSKEVRLEIVKRRGNVLSPTQFEVVISDSEKSVRLEGLRHFHLFGTEEQFVAILERGDEDEILEITRNLKTDFCTRLIQFPSPRVRAKIYSRQDIKLTEAEIEDGLCDPDIEVCAALVYRKDFVPSESMIHKMLSSQHALLRAKAFGRDEFIFSKSEYEKGLSDLDFSVPLAIIGRKDFKPSPTEFLKLISTGDSSIIYSVCRKASSSCLDEVLDRADLELIDVIVGSGVDLTSLQIEKVLAKSSPEVALMILNRVEAGLTIRQVEIALTSSNEKVRLHVLHLFGPENLTAKQIERCLCDPCEKIRIIVIEACSISTSQMEQSLFDESEKVRCATVQRLDFLPSVSQFAWGLHDESMIVKRAFMLKYKIQDGHVVSIAHESLKMILHEISSIKNWTNRKKELREELDLLLKCCGYSYFSMDARRGFFNAFGDNDIVAISSKQNGFLKSMRGKNVHIVRLEHGRYSDVAFAALPID